MVHTFNFFRLDVRLDLSLSPVPEAGGNASASFRLGDGARNHLLGDVPELTPRGDYISVSYL